MSSIYDDFEEVIRKHKERAAQQAQAAQDDERISRLENTITERLDRIESRFTSPEPVLPPDGNGSGDGSGAEPPGDSVPAPPPPSSDPELPLERVSMSGVPRIYQGDDEPEEVQYIDPDSGENKTRPGRRKGQPTRMQVESVVAPDPDPTPDA